MRLHTISAVFDQRSDAKAAVENLLEAGFDNLDIRSPEKMKQAKAIFAKHHERIQFLLKEGKPLRPPMPAFGSRWVGLKAKYSHAPADTAVKGEVLDRLADALVAIPAGFTLHKNLRDKRDDGKYPSNDSPYRRRDLIKKRREYADAGISEYWIVDPENSAITVLALKDGKFEVAGKYKPGQTAVSRLLPDFEIDVAEAFSVD